MDPAILSCVLAQTDNRVRYSRDSLLSFRNSVLTRKRPQYVDDAIAARRSWCRLVDLGDERITRGSGSNLSGTSTTSAGAASDYRAPPAVSTYLLPSFAIKPRPGDAKNGRKTDTSEAAVTQQSPQQQQPPAAAQQPPSRRGIYVAGGGPSSQLLSSNSGSGGASERDRRIGSGRIPARDVPWDYRPDKETPQEAEYNFRPSGGLLGLRDRDRGGSSGSSVTTSTANGNVEPLPPVLPPPQRSLLDRNDYRADRNDRNERSERGERDDRYDRRPFSRDFEKDRMGGGSGNSRGSHQNSRYSSNMQSGSGGNDRRRMYNENSGRTIEEPEWFSGGPTSQHDTIELRGFDEPEPDEKPPPPPPTDKTNDPETKLNNNTNISNITKNSNESRSDVDELANASAATTEDNVVVDDNNSTKAIASSSSPPARRSPTKNNDNNSKSERNKSHRNDQSGDDNFNFEDFLKMDSLSDLLTNNDDIAKDTSGTGESRFSRWFKRESPNRVESKSRRSSTHSEDPAHMITNSSMSRDKFFTPISPADPSSNNSNTLMEFLRRGKFPAGESDRNNAPPQIDGPAQPQPQQQQPQSNAQQQAGQIHSVEELEARMRTGGENTSNGPNAGSGRIQNQQDFMAFRKLLAQMSDAKGVTPPQKHQQPPPPMLQHLQQQHQQLSQQQLQQSAASLMQMLNKNSAQRPEMSGVTTSPTPHDKQLDNVSTMFPLYMTQPQQMQYQQQVRADLEAKMIKIGQQQDASKLAPNEAQALHQCLSQGDVSQQALLQKLSNPSIGAAERRVLLMALQLVRNKSRGPSPNVHAAPVIVTDGVPNAPVTPLLAPTTAPSVAAAAAADPISGHFLFQQHHPGQTAAVTQSKIRVSPLPSAFANPVMANSPITLHIPGVPQRIPSPRELQFHTQSIMQGALIKKKLEEQRENFRKRQELQNQQQQQNQPPTVTTGAAPGPNVVLPQQQQIQLVPPATIHPTSPAKHHTIAAQAQQQPQHHQHIASPTHIAFTPTSVLRKMTAEKEMDMMSFTGGAGAAASNKDLSKPPNMMHQLSQISQQHGRMMSLSLSLHHQQQQQQLQQQQQQQMQQQQQSQQQQQQQTAQQQIRANQIKWNNQFAQSKPAGRPIVKGGMPMPFASNIEFQQIQQQYQRKQQPSSAGGGSSGGNGNINAGVTGLISAVQQQQPGAGLVAIQQQQQQSSLIPAAVQQQLQPGNVSQQQQLAHLMQHRQQQQQQQQQQQRAAALRNYQAQYQQMMQQQQQQQQAPPSNNVGGGSAVVGGSVGGAGLSGMAVAAGAQINDNHGMIGFGREGALSPTSNQLARWFSPELLAQASAGKLPSLNIGQALSLEEFERSIQHSSATVHN